MKKTEFIITEEMIQAEVERLIEMSCEMNGRHGLIDIAKRVIELKAGTLEQRATLDFIIKNKIVKNYHYTYTD